MARKELDRFDTTAKRDMKISHKLIIIMGLSILFSCAAVATATLLIFSHRMIENEYEAMKVAMNGTKLEISDWKDTLEGFSTELADRTDILQAVKENDSATLQKICRRRQEIMNFSFMAIVDESGKTCPGSAVGIPESSNLSNLACVKNALSGRTSSTYEPAGNVSFAAVAAVPFYIDSHRAGCVITGYDLVNGEFIEIIHGSYNSNCTVFQGNTVVSSTILDENGNQSIGSTLDDQVTLKKVMQEGEPFTTKGKLYGREYLAAFLPIEADNGIPGMISLGRDLSHIYMVTYGTINYLIPGILIVAIITLISVYMFVRWLMWRIYNVTNTLQDMATGDADLTKRVKLLIRDEIGDLVIQFDSFCDKLQHIVAEVKNSKNELSTSGSDLSASMEDTSSAITQIIQNINGVHRQISTQNTTVTQTAKALNDITTTIAELDGMIESQSAGITEASAAIEEMIGNISSVNNSVDKMASSFQELTSDAQTGFTKQQDVNDRIHQIEVQSEMLQEANLAISSIAEQTNLLAMNAAIEAAHAGEAGKGFSVVADEIRKLSETSSSQSKTIGEQLNNIKDSISEVVNASNESSLAFTSVSNKIKETDQLVAQIKCAMEEQNAGSKQIGETLHSMTDSTMEVHKASKNMSSKSETIIREMHSLQDISEEMMQSMKEMSSGATKINETGTALGEISSEVQKAIGKIGDQIDLFKV